MRTFTYEAIKHVYTFLSSVCSQFTTVAVQLTGLCIGIDELALLFTGSHIPDSFPTTDRETVEEEAEETNGSASGSPLPTPLASNTPIEAPEPPTYPSAPISHALTAPIIHPTLLDVPRDAQEPHFAIEQLGVDRRLIVNRKRQLKMYRVWMQGKFRKP